jgi:hypothetical protein
MPQPSVFFTSLKVVIVVFLLTLASALPAQAGVEFVAPVNSCTSVFKSDSNRDLAIIAGRNVQFRVFGNSVDLTNRSSGFQVVPPNSNGVTGQIINQGRDCNFTGFSTVRVDSSVRLADSTRRTLTFKMPLGDISPLRITIKPLPAINAIWTTNVITPPLVLPSSNSQAAQSEGIVLPVTPRPSPQPGIDCIVKTGKLEKLDQNHTLRLELPPGHRQDRSTCSQNTLIVWVTPSQISGGVDISRPATRYIVEGLPDYLTANQFIPKKVTEPQEIRFSINVNRLRRIATARNSSITVRSPISGKISRLNLEVIPNLNNGFTQAPICRNRQTGNTVNVEDLVECGLSLAIPPDPEQLVTFEVLDRLCVEAGSPDVDYSSVTGIGTTKLQGSGTVFNLPLRTINGTRSDNRGACASETGSQHTVKFWLGDKTATEGETTGTFRIRSVQ